MAKEYSRTQRLAELLQRELAQLILREVKDPRLGMVTISDVKMSRDLAYAKVYVTVLGDEDTIKQSIETLNHVSGFLRSMLGKRVKARIMPHLTFVYDSSIAEGNRMSALIDAALKDDKERFGDDSESE